MIVVGLFRMQYGGTARCVVGTTASPQVLMVETIASQDISVTRESRRHVPGSERLHLTPPYGEDDMTIEEARQLVRDAIKDAPVNWDTSPIKILVPKTSLVAFSADGKSAFVEATVIVALPCK